MPQLRVYELAKELGLENKALLDLCQQLGFDEKSSHSNSLTDDEAEKVRRFVIRRAVSERGTATREVSKEGQLLTESRLGSNVIRRRKKDEEPEAPSKAQIDLNVVPKHDLPTLAPDLEAERRTRNQALKDADALFAPKEAPAREAQEAKGETAEAPVVDEAQASESEPELADEDQSAPEADADKTEQAEEEATELEAGTDTESSNLADVRRRHDIRAPKVLGKIDLPVKAPPPKKPAPAAATPAAAPAEGFDDGELERGDGRGKKKKGKTVERGDLAADSGARKKKKQVLRKDELVDYDGERDGWRKQKGKKGGKREENGVLPAQEAGPTKQSKKVVKIPGHISVGELAKQLSVKVSEVIGILMKLGTMAGINQLIDHDTASIVASEFGYTTQNTDQDVEEVIEGLKEVDAPESLLLRPPVVTVMGHVDHGKTSLLDAIRSTSVTKGEVGGITQHIGAYNVTLPSGGSVTFLDTPGHEAFTAMRSRGAKLTDIVVLVVAADDGVMPQTIEAINHAKAANVPIIVAVNKIDKEGGNRDRVITQLSEHGLIPEEWGGETLVCNVSALTKQGIDKLLESLHLQAEILELKANPNRRATGTVVEGKVDKGRGSVVTVLVQNGTLRKGDVFVSGAVFGRVRALYADNGERVDEASPSIPVEVLGASGTPRSGDDFMVFESEAQAREIAQQRQQGLRLKELADEGAGLGGALTLEKFSQMVSTASDLKELPLIVKGDVQGSVEAVSDALARLSNDEVKVKIVHRAVGAINENDVQLASASNGILVGFNVRADARAQTLIDNENLQVLYSRVIYELVDLVEKALKGLKAPVFREKTLGRVEVRQTFRVPRLGVIAGSYVLDGTIARGSSVRLVRDSRVIYEGKMASLRRFKDDVREVQAGYECGIGIEGYSDIKDGDIIEVFKVEQVPVS